MNFILQWLRQPTSVAGISALFGVMTALGLHQITLLQSGPLFAGALVSIVLPDNTVAKADAERLATALLTKVNFTGDKK